jgi:acyl-CoA reductase-like NAD-dependent aldehyde dehydrogenase
MQEFHMLINGAMIAGDLQMTVLNPATETIIAQCPRASERQLNEAVAAAKAAFPGWSAQPWEERRRALLAIADTIDAHRAELARLLTLEQGKPLSDATDETTWMADFYRYFASLNLPVRVLEESEARRVELKRRPLGVVAAITPWNYPLSLSALKLPPALLAGNTVVLKPAPTTPLATLRFAELVAKLLPPGVLNVIADANDLGGLLTQHPDVRKVSFTGSTATGKKVMASAAESLKRITLELGGNDPAIVLNDADPKAVAPKVFQSAFQNNGQICFAIKRLYVHEDVYEEVCAELIGIAGDIVVDDGMKQGARLGPLQNKVQFEKVKEYLRSAEKDGKIIAGGKVMERPGYFIEPTIVRDITDGSRLVDEEQFGPILPVIKYSEVDDVVARANASTYGLGASVWSSNRERALAIANRIEAGTVWINKHTDLPTHVPFGGSKESGIGLEFGEEGLAEFTQAQVINA